MRLHGTRRAAIAQARGLGNPLWDLAGVPPSLDLRFAESKSLIDAVSGQQLITFTRASTGTYVDSDGVIRSAANDIPRFNHNPLTGECLGLLVEEQRQNLLLQSEDFSTTWSKDAGVVITTNSASSPDGTITADLLDGTGATNFIAQSISITSGATYTISAWVKSAGLGKDTFRLFGDSSQFSGLLTATNTWQRFTFTFISANTASRTHGITRDASNNPIGLYIWGAQLEAGAFPTSYIPTTGTAATRTADVASISGTNFSSWYRQDEGSIFTDALTTMRFSGSNAFPRILNISDGGNSNNVELYYRVLSAYTDAGYAVASSGVSQAGFDTASETNGSKLAVAAKTDSFSFNVSGLTRSTDNSGTLPILNQVSIGKRPAGANVFTGTIRRITYFPQRLPDSTLQSITL
jgi:hypothetical protein